MATSRSMYSQSINPYEEDPQKKRPVPQQPIQPKTPWIGPGGTNPAITNTPTMPTQQQQAPVAPAAPQTMMPGALTPNAARLGYMGSLPQRQFGQGAMGMQLDPRLQQIAAMLRGVSPGNYPQTYASPTYPMTMQSGGMGGYGMGMGGYGGGGYSGYGRPAYGGKK